MEIVLKGLSWYTMAWITSFCQTQSENALGFKMEDQKLFKAIAILFWVFSFSQEMASGQNSLLEASLTKISNISTPIFLSLRLEWQLKALNVN